MRNHNQLGFGLLGDNWRWLTLGLALPVISHRASGPILRNLDQGCQRADDNKYGTVGLILAHTLHSVLYGRTREVTRDVTQIFATTSGDYNKNVSAGQKSSDGSLLFPRRSVATRSQTPPTNGKGGGSLVTFEGAFFGKSDGFF